MQLAKPTEKSKLFSVFHYHEYNGTHYLLWSESEPDEQSVIEALEIDFEPEKDEWISIDEMTSIEVV